MKLVLIVGISDKTASVVTSLLNFGINQTSLIVKQTIPSSDIVELVNKNQIGKIIACDIPFGTAECYAKKISKNVANQPPVWLLTNSEHSSRLVRVIKEIDQIFKNQTA